MLRISAEGNIDFYVTDYYNALDKDSLAHFDNFNSCPAMLADITLKLRDRSTV